MNTILSDMEKRATTIELTSIGPFEPVFEIAERF